MHREFIVILTKAVAFPQREDLQTGLARVLGLVFFLAFFGDVL